MNRFLLPVLRFGKECRGYIWTDTGVGLDIRVATRSAVSLGLSGWRTPFIFGCIFIARRSVHVCVCVYIYTLIS